MADVLISPGLPGPWLPEQKETPVLKSRLSSKELLSPPKLDNFLLINNSLTQSSGSEDCNIKFSNSQHQRQHPLKQRHLRWQRPESTETQVHCNSSTPFDTNMAHVRVSTRHHSGNLDTFMCHESSTNSYPFQTPPTSNAYPLTAPAMKTTRSSSGMSSSSQFVSDSFELRESALPNTEVDESHEVFQSMARNGLSFGSGSESSPSLSSSFDFMDIPKENPLPYGLPLLDDSFSGHRSTKGILSQTQDTPFIADTLAGNNINSSLQWSMGVENESWHPHYHSDRLEWSVPSTLTFSSWPISENMDLSCQDTQLISPYNFTHDNLQSTNNKHTTLPSAPIPGKPDHSSITALGMGTLQAHPSSNDSPTYTSLPSMAEYNTSFPTPGSSTIHPEPPQLQPENPAIKASLHYSDARNALLIEWKRAGLSYKDIKRIGGFKEAESTLRGRFRTLTKAKEQRVRKPTWLKRDVSMHGTKASRLLRNMDQSLTRALREYQIQLLCEAVAICTGPVSKSSTGYASLAQVNMAMAMTGQPPKVSWKKVAQYIWSHGGSYQFGNATCKKKWCDIMGLRSERGT